MSCLPKIRLRVSQGNRNITSKIFKLTGQPGERNRDGPLAYFFSGIFPVVKYCSTSSSVRPLVSGRKNAAVMK